ncbi:MAG: DNA-binding protein WhiA [Eubacterium sp.]|nr:DNA-binding protein WhiA [Eubacterium sp.]MDE5974814.1 DNA-binding protein WhiA [Eubacterium sp.]
MSFSQDVKNELLKIEYENSCCEKAMLYGICIFGKSFSSFGVSMQSENEELAKHYKELIKKYCNVECAVKRSPGGRNYSVNIEDSTDCDKILGAFGHSDKGSLKINHSNFDCEGCINAFVAGAFLSCGTVSTPQKDYHLEFTVPYLNLSKSLVTLLGEIELSPKTSNRKGYNIIYFKGSEAIEDCLYLMGASSAMFEMMNIEIVKDFRNKANRTANCEAANIEKTVKASFTHIKAIEKIESTKGLDYLKNDLKEMAVLRRDNPELSLAELSKLSGMSRSGVNHRLKRITQIAENL